jgi:UPF0176 protein
VSLRDYRELSIALKALCDAHRIKGTILLAEEGINAGVAGPQAGIEAFMAYLAADGRFSDLKEKYSYTEAQPFHRMKVKAKKEIIALGRPEVDPTKQVGTYVKAKDWNAVISDPDVILVDTRNSYEVEVGTFQGALDPNTRSFRQFPEYVEHNLDATKHKKVAMFCTGGIRCEKASSLLLAQGFEEVYHLEGGILKYLEDVSPEESLWQGECFVFDGRVAVDHDLKPGTHLMCHACGNPLHESDAADPRYKKGVSCPRCADTQTEKNRKAAEDRQRQMDLAKKRNKIHLGS